MKNRLLVVSLLVVGLFLISHKSYKKPTAESASPIAPVVKSVQRQTASIVQKPFAPARPLPQVSLTKTSQAASIGKNPQAKPIATVAATSKVATAPSNIAEVPTTPTVVENEVVAPNMPTKKDLELLKAAAERSQQQGSKVAYIGEMPALYAFEPRFFTQQSGQILGVDETVGSQYVQREPYPIPDGNIANYALLSKVIIRATDDGANLINIAAANVDRTQLSSSIRYAQSHGVPVVNVAPHH